jgi:hypothetical protein
MLSNAIKGRVLENSVMMTGRLDNAAKWGAYASLFLLPSRQVSPGQCKWAFPSPLAAR